MEISVRESSGRNVVETLASGVLTRSSRLHLKRTLESLGMGGLQWYVTPRKRGDSKRFQQSVVSRRCFACFCHLLEEDWVTRPEGVRWLREGCLVIFDGTSQEWKHKLRLHKRPLCWFSPNISILFIVSLSAFYSPTITTFIFMPLHFHFMVWSIWAVERHVIFKVNWDLGELPWSRRPHSIQYKWRCLTPKQGDNKVAGDIVHWSFTSVSFYAWLLFF